MNYVHALFLRQRDDARDVEIRAHRSFALTNQISLVRLEAMNRQPIFLRVDGHGAETQLGGRAKNADGDFTSVGDQQFALAGHWSHFKAHRIKQRR